MSALVLTPPVFVDLLILCLSWEWEDGVDKFRAQLGKSDVTELRFPEQRGFTTVDKILRILVGLGIVTDKQKRVLYKSRPLQSLVLRRLATATYGDIHSFRKQTQKDLVLRCDPVEDINREKMLRTMHFFISETGETTARSLVDKYRSVITKEQYLAEIKLQEARLPKGSSKRAAVIDRYRQRVEEETR